MIFLIASVWVWTCFLRWLLHPKLETWYWPNMTWMDIITEPSSLLSHSVCTPFLSSSSTLYSLFSYYYQLLLVHDLILAYSLSVRWGQRTINDRSLLCGFWECGIMSGVWTACSLWGDEVPRSTGPSLLSWRRKSTMDHNHNRRHLL